MHVRIPQVDAIGVMRRTLEQMTPDQLHALEVLIRERRGSHQSANITFDVKSNEEKLKARVASLETRMALLERSMKTLIEERLKVGPHNMHVRAAG